MENSIEIYIGDLTLEKQAEILAKLGNNGNFDTFPITIIPIGEDEPSYNKKDCGSSNIVLPEAMCGDCVNLAGDGNRRKDDCDRQGCNLCMQIFVSENGIEDIWSSVPLDRKDLWEAMTIIHTMGALEENGKITIPYHSYDERVRIACELAGEWTQIHASTAEDIEDSPVEFAERRLVEKFEHKQ